MIAIRKKTDHELKICKAAQAAIAKGVKRGDAVAQLEFLGFLPRYMNLLENSSLNIITLEQLLNKNQQELLEIPGFGRSALGQLMECLAQYHELEKVIGRQEEADRREPGNFLNGQEN